MVALEQQAQPLLPLGPVPAVSSACPMLSALTGWPAPSRPLLSQLSSITTLCAAPESQGGIWASGVLGSAKICLTRSRDTAFCVLLTPTHASLVGNICLAITSLISTLGGIRARLIEPELTRAGKRAPRIYM